MDLPDPRRALPKVDAVLAESALEPLIESEGRRQVVEWVRREIDAARAELARLHGAANGAAGGVNSAAHGVHTGGGDLGTKAPAAGGDAPGETTAARFGPGEIARRVRARARAAESARLRPVLNATGVVLHTNLGRAPLSPEARRAVDRLASGYANLEYDLSSGARGSRHAHVAELLRYVTGAEAAMVVNNNAAAVLLALAALPRSGEVVISRGELIEIGGSFRIPDVLEQSGCRLREVGTTNRTRLDDYASAITEETAAILKVHSSNYRVIGFAQAVPGRELVRLARERGLPCFEDLGSGVLLSTEPYGVRREPTVQESVASGMDIVTFSGDKLLGGPQAGLIVGRADSVERCRRHPLARALRPGKLTLGALAATLAAYVRGTAEEEIPIWRMMALTAGAIGARAEAIAGRLRRQGSPLEVDVRDGWSTPGGGSLPEERLPTRLLALRSEAGAGALADRLRAGDPPVVARIEGDRVLLDLRTVEPEEDEALADALLAAEGGDRRCT